VSSTNAPAAAVARTAAEKATICASVGSWLARAAAAAWIANRVCIVRLGAVAWPPKSPSEELADASRRPRVEPQPMTLTIIGKTADDPLAEVDLAIDAQGDLLEIDSEGDVIMVEPAVDWTGKSAGAGE
jgi:hypothetical protein